MHHEKVRSSEKREQKVHTNKTEIQVHVCTSGAVDFKDETKFDNIGA